MWWLLQRLLFLLSAETAHHWTLRWMRLWSWWLERVSTVKPVEQDPFEWFGQRYPNRLGLAAGLDKGTVAVSAWFRLGFGFVEIGTVTPRPQPGNPKPRLFRAKGETAIINRMGFNNEGAEVVRQRLASLKQRPGPIWVNIGKNKDTPNDRAADDYESALQTLYAVGDAFVVNISSPNTPGLRDLQSETALRPLLQRIVAKRSTLGVHKPLLLKLSPDLSVEALHAAVDSAVAAGFEGLIATNTTLSRPYAGAAAPAEYAEAGGLSGLPLQALADQTLQRVVERARGRLMVVGVGGVDGASAARRKRELGATLVQTYSSLIYRGPGLVRSILAGWQRS